MPMQALKKAVRKRRPGLTLPTIGTPAKSAIKPVRPMNGTDAYDRERLQGAAKAGPFFQACLRAIARQRKRTGRASREVIIPVVSVPGEGLPPYWTALVSTVRSLLVGEGYASELMGRTCAKGGITAYELKIAL